MHVHEAGYGVGGTHHRNDIAHFAELLEAKTLLDYGCGKGRLVQMLDCRGYDPAVEEFEADPSPADLVFSTDFLEHTSTQTIDGVLQHIANLARKGTWHAIHTGPAMFHLPDGTNCHTLQADPEWWRVQFEMFFKKVAVVTLSATHCVVHGLAQ
jgi:SAM-dependent methyltransferase